ncbi:hypothetical protein [Owenweeksia hongkongensis]|uniref:hypothetical protein n=1 Tax=Owenweeksia hongkongensis TaxID=253245 RepID=UPI003A8DF868
MKRLIATSLLLSLSFLSKAQETENPKFFNAADPTQLYTNVNLNAGITFSGRSAEAMAADYWQVNLGGEFAVKKFNFGFNIPFSNLGNFYTGIVEVDLHAGFQPFNRNKFFKSSLITAGVVLPSHDGYGYFEGLNSNRVFYLDYTASLKFNDKISVFPKVGLEKGSNVDENAPRFNLTSYKASLGGSYQINAKNFLKLNLSYAHTTRVLVNENYAFYGFENSLESNSLLTSLKYQYAITPKTQVYSKLNVDFGERFENNYYGYNLTQPGIFLGFQYFIK